MRAVASTAIPTCVFAAFTLETRLLIGVPSIHGVAAVGFSATVGVTKRYVVAARLVIVAHAVAQLTFLLYSPVSVWLNSSGGLVVAFSACVSACSDVLVFVGSPMAPRQGGAVTIRSKIE